MVKNYTFLFLIASFVFSIKMSSQEIQIFRVNDFDLKSDVKSCLVRTNYGKEEYDFSEDGLLTKSVTRYSDSDYDITYYKYSKGMLLEKRVENYRDKVFDKSTSLASLFTIDSLLNLKITEKIVSYNNKFLDQYQYYYKSDSIFKIIHSNDSGIDETLVSYKDVKGEQTKTYKVNGVVIRSIRSSLKKENDSVIERTTLTKNFLDGAPYEAVEEIYDGRNRLQFKTLYNNGQNSNTLVKELKKTYFYDENNALKKIETDHVQRSETEEYIYQFDEKQNWTKEIITPDNTYKTREISYYSTPEPKEE